MRHAAILVLVLGLIGTGCSSEQGSEPVDNPVLTDWDIMMDGVPDKADLVDEKTDLIVPRAYDLVDDQSSVKSQGNRGMCSVFTATALAEHLYIKEGSFTDPDFSEQYLQWLVKFEVKAFPNTVGANAKYSLQAINEYGAVNEIYWPFETAQWDTSNDEACDGSNTQPTRCYTNGEPPRTVENAKKFKLSKARCIASTPESIKSYMLNNGLAVQSAVTFFYQAWNSSSASSSSPLPNNQGYWNKGYVLSPNKKDEEESLKIRKVGHAFLLVGWDDDMEVQKVDGEGNPMEDAQGNPIMEKGFFLFKNSWGTGSFGKYNPRGNGYGWIAYSYMEKWGNSTVCDLPENIPEICGDGVDNDGDGDTDCDDTACALYPQCQTGPKEYENTTVVDIPDNDENGVVSTIEVAESGAIQALSVTVDITHTYSGDVEILLTHPDGTIIRLREPTSEGPNIQKTWVPVNFDQKDSAGTWKLKVIDHASGDTGKLKSWVLKITR